MVVQDPAKKHSHRDVEAIFERVRSLGAQEGPVAEPPRPLAAPASSRFFSGSSNTLTGESRQQSEQVASEPGSRASPPAAIVHNVHFWRNGFTVNDGPLRRLDDVSNLPFLEVRSINWICSVFSALRNEVCALQCIAKIRDSVEHIT